MYVEGAPMSCGGRADDRNARLSKEEGIEVQGTVTKTLPNAMFKVQLDEPAREVIVYLSGKMRKYHIRIVEGDRVRVELSPYDLTQGRIVYRER